MKRAKRFCYEFLQERRAITKLNDEWVIADGLPGEIGYALDFPWKASLPRVETRMYLEQYGAGRDVWIGKSLYRLPLVNNDLYHNMAKADFKCFQRSCQLEWHGINKWYAENDLEVYGVTHKSALTAFFLAAANIFEPNRADERLGWARTAVLAEAISSRLNSLEESEDGLLSTLDQLIGSLAPDSTASGSLREAWKKWLLTWTSKERCHNAIPEENTAPLIIRTEGPDLQKAEELDRQVDMEMQKLALLVLQNYNAADRLSNRTFLDVVKSFCYIAHCSPETVDRHIFMVMFDNLIR
uniref:Uncharacterized protein n=1 Tax=Oryza nivara TaxID=4536 RepID=A0A0E0FIG0_ORYNI